MKILLDQNVTPSLRRVLSRHTVVHSRDLGWSTLPDTLLLRSAEQQQFDLLITVDKDMVDQQNHRIRRIALLVLSTCKRKAIRAAHPAIMHAVETIEPAGFTYLVIPDIRDTL